MVKVEVERKVRLKQPHTFTLKIVGGLLGDVMAFYVDGQLAKKHRAGDKGDNELPFTLDGRPFYLKWRTRWNGTFTSVLIESNGRVMVLHGDESAVAQADPNDFTVGMPMWGWLFVAACLVMPLVGIGWVVALLVGPLTAVMVYRTARDGYQPMRLRALICGGLTILAWTVVYMLDAMYRVIFLVTAA
jgi:hypothetical protein